MNNFEFKSYTPTPTDQYMLGIAKVKLYGKLVVNFKHVKTKDGSGTFFCTSNYVLNDPSGEKKYVSCIQLDSRDDEDMLMDFIRHHVNMVLAQKSVQQAHPTQPQPAAYYPHGMTQMQYTQPAPTSMSEVSANEAIPF